MIRSPPCARGTRGRRRSGTVAAKRSRRGLHVAGGREPAWIRGAQGVLPGGAVTGKTSSPCSPRAAGRGAQVRATGAWYIMTSPLNHADTVGYFERNSYLASAARTSGFSRRAPCLADLKTGRVLLATKGELATNPDGHGGSLKASHASAALADMRRRGVEHISYFQWTTRSSGSWTRCSSGCTPGRGLFGEMSSKMIPKAYAEEKLGVFCTGPSTPPRGTGVPPVPTPLRLLLFSLFSHPAHPGHRVLRPPHGASAAEAGRRALRFLAGSVAVHAISVAFVERLNTDWVFSLPGTGRRRSPCIDRRPGPDRPRSPTA